MKKQKTEENKPNAQRGPKAKPAEEKGKTVAAYVDAALYKQIETVRYTRERKQSSIIAEAIAAGLEVVAAKYNEVRQLPADWNGFEALPK